MSDGDRGAERRLRAFLEGGAVMAGDTTAVTWLCGGSDQSLSINTTAWPAVGMFLRGAEEFAARNLTARERERAGAVVAHAVRRFDENLRGGLTVRGDRWFVSEQGLRSPADQVMEAILAGATGEYEEEKLPYFGTLVANVVCHEKTDRSQALLMIRVARELSYRQYGLLAMFAYQDRFGLRATDYAGERRISFGTVAVLQEIGDLERRSLLLQTNGTVLGIRDLIPAGLAPVGLGDALVKRMGLNRISSDELEELAAFLR